MPIITADELRQMRDGSTGMVDSEKGYKYVTYQGIIYPGFMLPEKVWRGSEVYVSLVQGQLTIGHRIPHMISSTDR